METGCIVDTFTLYASLAENICPEVLGIVILGVIVLRDTGTILRSCSTQR